MKVCVKCKKLKKSNSFHKNKSKPSGLASWCIECDRESRLKNKKLLNKRSRKYYQNNKERIIALKLKNRDTKKYNKYMRDRRAKSLSIKIHAVLSASINYYIKKRKTPVKNILPYTVDELIKHLESNFKEGMNWSNYGVYRKNSKMTWHIDHVKPVSYFKFSSINDKNIIECWSLNNLKPMWAVDNIKKGKKYEE